MVRGVYGARGASARAFYRAALTPQILLGVNYQPLFTRHTTGTGVTCTSVRGRAQVAF